jgi:hypothetical protein
MDGNIFPFTILFPLTEVSTAARSSPASRRATRPFAGSFGISNPHSGVILLPQDSSSSGKTSGLHQESHRRPPPPLVSLHSTASHR